MINISNLHRCFTANAEAGTLTWNPTYRYAGELAGTITSEGYRVVGVIVDGKQRKLLAHRVLWAMHFGEWPKQQIDHINRVKHDNRIENLRDVPPSVNQQNRAKSVAQPAEGVRTRGRTFTAYIGGGRRGQKHLGTFSTLNDAIAARAAAMIGAAS